MQNGKKWGSAKKPFESDAQAQERTSSFGGKKLEGLGKSREKRSLPSFKMVGTLELRGTTSKRK